MKGKGKGREWEGKVRKWKEREGRRIVPYPKQSGCQFAESDEWMLKTAIVGCRKLKKMFSGEGSTPCSFRSSNTLKCPTHPLHYMIPPRKVSTSQITLRPTYPFSAPKCKKTRYGRDLIPYCIANKY